MTGYQIAGPSGRNSEFAGGQSGNGQQVTAMNQQPKKIGKFRPDSALDMMQQAGYHPNDGNSADDVARQTPGGQLPGPNGSAPDTYDAETPKMMTRLAA
jgi:hypothetical protein